MFTRLKKLFVQDEESKKAEEEFDANCAKLRKNQQDLVKAQRALTTAIARIDRKKDDLRNMTKTSGQHAFALPVEEPHDDPRKSKPSF